MRWLGRAPLKNTLNTHSTSIRDCTSPNRVQALNINAFIYIEGRDKYTHTHFSRSAERKRMNEQTNKQTKKKREKKELHKVKLIENGFISVSICFMLLPYGVHAFSHCTVVNTLFGSKTRIKMCVYVFLVVVVVVVVHLIPSLNLHFETT